MIQENIGDRLRQSRQRMNMTQDDVIEALRKRFSFNMARETLSKWENSKQEPTIFPVNCLAKIYGVSTDYLIDGIKENDDIDKRINLLEKAMKHMSTVEKEKLVSVARIMFPEAIEAAENEQ